MFVNVGNKIKGLAWGTAVLGMLGSAAAGCISWSQALVGYDGGGMLFWKGLLVMTLGSLLSWLLSCLLYAFGTLTEHAQRIADALERAEERQDQARSDYAAHIKWICPACGTLNGKDSRFCICCHAEKIHEKEKYGFPDI